MNTLTFKPAAKLITAIGRDLIKDVPAAVVELVKNSYDADATEVHLTYRQDNNGRHKITVQDNGHGMDYETILNYWMVPGASNKLNKTTSPRGRRYQGRKGLGRYAVALLGNNFELVTIQNGIRTSLEICWDEFDNARFMDEVDLRVQSVKTTGDDGTEIIIYGDQEYEYVLSDSNKKEIQDELKRMINPLNGDDSFRIYLTDNNENTKIELEPIPIMEVYHYRLYGIVNDEGKADLTFESYMPNLDPVKIDKIIQFDKGQKNCGKIKLDLRVFDKDSQGITDVQSKLEQQNFSLRANEIRKLLKNFSGVSIYRNGFRIRPYGDPKFDWLKLDNKRIQNPVQCIGSDQVLGFIEIETEEQSGLEEKSARDGLKENESFMRLLSITDQCISELENRRMNAKKAKAATNKQDTKNNMDSIVNTDSLQDRVHQSVASSIDKITEKHPDDKEIEQIAKKLHKTINTAFENREKEARKEVRRVKSIIAMYQSQGTLGKIVSVVLHEGRGYLGYIKNSIPNVLKWVSRIGKGTEVQKISDRLTKIKDRSEMLSNLFKKLDPLTVTRRSSPKVFILKSIVDDVIDIFGEELKKNNIKVKVDIEDSIKVKFVKEDLYMCLVNLIENSIHWTKGVERRKEVKIFAVNEGKECVLNVMDTGVGIEEEYIKNKIIFDPGFSKKEDGTGLGLTIAGEALERNNASIRAVYRKNGSHFQITFDKGDERYDG